MRWTTNYVFRQKIKRIRRDKQHEWHLWFAWFPVHCGEGKWSWMEDVARLRLYGYDDGFIYRRPDHSQFESTLLLPLSKTVDAELLKEFLNDGMYT